MSDSEQSFSWYEPGNIRATVENGLANDIATSNIAEYLSEQEFDDVPQSRLERIVDTMPTSEDTAAATPNLSQPPATDAEPRDALTNQLAVYDLEYVSNREAARLIGLALEQFDGNTVRPPGTTQVETDLVWHRQRMTVALRIVPAPSGTVDTSHIDALLNGTVVPDDVRTPSKLAIVTNRSFTDDAVASAEEHDIHCFDGGHVEEWLRRARIPMDAVGTLLEDGESHDGPLTDLVELPPIPGPRKAIDPLEVNRAFDIDSLRTSSEDEDTTPSTERKGTTKSQEKTGLDRSTARDYPLRGTQPASGETGTLYADPGEDGDFDAFDRFVEDISNDNQQQRDQSDANDQTTGDDAASSVDGDSTSDDEINRGTLVFDLKEAKKDAGEPMSSEDVEKYGSYSIEDYKKEFGSIADALSAAHIGFTEGSL